MRPSRIHWRFSFSSDPGGPGLQRLADLLDLPSAPVEAPGFGRTLSEWGLREYQAHAPEMTLDAGSLALELLLKGHRLAFGWAILWPGFRRVEGGWPREEVERARHPDCLDGLAAMWDRSVLGSSSDQSGLEYASATVEILPEPVLPPAPAPAPAAADLPPPAVEPALRIQLDSLLERFGRMPWSFHPATDRLVLEASGMYRVQEDQEQAVYLGGDLQVRQWLQGGRTGTLEFVLMQQPDPHLLEETEFDRIQQRIEGHFTDLVARATGILGEPEFAGASGEAGFPSDQWAEWLAVWRHGGRRLMLQTRHDDRELPLELLLVFAPGG